MEGNEHNNMSLIVIDLLIGSVTLRENPEPFRILFTFRIHCQLPLKSLCGR